jgi:hypothetical protein
MDIHTYIHISSNCAHVHDIHRHIVAKILANAYIENICTHALVCDCVVHISIEPSNTHVIIRIDIGAHLKTEKESERERERELCTCLGLSQRSSMVKRRHC